MRRSGNTNASRLSFIKKERRASPASIAMAVIRRAMKLEGGGERKKSSSTIPRGFNVSSYLGWNFHSFVPWENCAFLPPVPFANRRLG